VNCAVDFEDAPFQAAHWKLAIGATTGYISDGYTLGVVGIALAAAQPELGLSAAWQGSLGGASLAGLFMGALASGSFADRYGRRPVFAYNMILFAALSALQLFVSSPWSLLLLRIGLGAILGSDYVVCKALLLEFMPRSQRGRVLSTMGVSWAIGYAVAYLVGFELKDVGAMSWRLILASSAIPALLTIPLRMNAPESPLWLVLMNRRADAQRIVDEAFATKGYRLPLLDPRQTAAQRATEGPLSRRLRGVTALASLLYVCLVMPYFAVSTFIPQVMSSLRVAGSELAGLIYIAWLLFGAIAGFVVVDWLPRRIFIVGCFAITSVALLLTATLTNLPAAALILLFSLFACVLSAAQTQVYVYIPELFPTAVRAGGLGVAVAASRIGAAAGTFLLPLCVAYLGVRVALFGCVAVLVVGGVACQVWAPETRKARLAVAS
jgi:putative MFS transporter